MTPENHFELDTSAPAVSVVEAVASVVDKDPWDLDPLGDVVDPDALNRLVTSEQKVKVSFEYEGTIVTVTSSDEISVIPTEAKADELWAEV